LLILRSNVVNCGTVLVLLCNNANDLIKDTSISISSTYLTFAGVAGAFGAFGAAGAFGVLTVFALACFAGFAGAAFAAFLGLTLLAGFAVHRFFFAG
jgi:hypothetical protein